MFIFNPYHMTLRATCNDTMKVFFDGYLQPETAAMGRWNETSYLNIPANTNVLAIECKNSEYQYGILASSLTGLKTDASWHDSVPVFTLTVGPCLALTPHLTPSPMPAAKGPMVLLLGASGCLTFLAALADLYLSLVVVVSSLFWTQGMTFET